MSGEARSTHDGVPGACSLTSGMVLALRSNGAVRGDPRTWRRAFDGSRVARRRICEGRSVQPQDATVLLEAEHAVARVLAARPGLPLADAELLGAIGGALGWDVGAAWETGD